MSPNREGDPVDGGPRAGKGGRLTREQVDALRDAAYAGDDPPWRQRRDDAMVTLLYDAGLDTSGLVDLDVAHVAENCGHLSLPDETVELDQSGTLGTRRTLATYLADRDEGVLFPSRTGDRITERGVRYVVDRLAERAGVSPGGPDGDWGDPTEVSPQLIADSGPRGDGGNRLSGRGLTAEQAVDTLVDVFYVVDENGRFQRWNDRFVAVTGYSEEEMAELHALDVVPREDRETIAEAMAAVFEDGTVQTRESHLVTADGERVPYEFNGAPITEDDEVVGLAGVGRDLTERKRRERRLRRYQTTVEAVEEGIYYLDTEGRFQAVNDVIEERTGYSREELVGEHASKLLSAEDVQNALDAIRELADGDREVGTVDVGIQTASGDVIPTELRIALLWSGEEIRGTVGVARDISERKAHERELARQRDELERLDRINAVIRDIDRSLVQATTREEIEQAVCDRLAAVDPFVWVGVGERQPGSTSVRRRASAGDEVCDAFAGDSEAVRSTIDGGELQVVRGNERSQPEGNCESVVAAPIEYGETQYGVVVVAANDAPGFEEGGRGLPVLAELGETIGHAITAVERKEALATDDALELELGVEDAAAFFARVTKDADATATLDGVVSPSGNGYLEYYTVEGAIPESVREAAESADVDGVTIVEAEDRECLCEVEVSESRMVATVAGYGGSVRSLTAEEGYGTAVVELPRTASVSGLVESLDATLDAAELLAKRRTERNALTDSRFRFTVTDRLTDRQHAAIRSAYFAGFFERPRQSTGQEVARSLELSPSTFHQHLRTGLRKLVDVAVDPSDERG